MFNQQTRNELLSKVTTQEWDLIIIGGGITGAGILLDASSRGLKSLLIEMNDFASGTSSKSTKLIHGGLRYLKQAQIGVVRDSVKERAILHRNAPNLVQVEKMFLPVVKKSGFSKLELWAGLSLYDFLGSVSKDDKKTMLSKKEARLQEPLFNQQEITGAALYTEYRTDDARLVIEIIKKARVFGAEALNYCKLDKFVLDEVSGKVLSIEISDQLLSKTYQVRAHYYINATGAWCDDIATKENTSHQSRIVISKGSHIVIPRSKLALSQSVYFPANDKRMIFAIPRQDCIYIGTTDVFYFGDKGHLRITEEEIEYLLVNLNLRFPDSRLKKVDIISHWVGMRPLIKPKGASLSHKASELSRRDEIFTSESGVIHITGGKLTGYRKMAMKVVNKLTNKKCTTDSILLTQHSDKEIEIEIERKHPLYFRYGAIYQDILAIDPDPFVAELKYCLQNEMVLTPLDFIERRTGYSFFKPQLAQSQLPMVIEVMSDYLDWDEQYSSEIYQRTLRDLEYLSLKF